jgi:hypothetical protein
MLAAALQVLGALLKEKAAHSAGTLLSWALQRPQLIDMDLIGTAGLAATPTGLFFHSTHFLILAAQRMVHVGDASSSSSSNIGTYAAAMTQQLEQSGAGRQQCVALQLFSCETSAYKGCCSLNPAIVRITITCS